MGIVCSMCGEQYYTMTQPGSSIDGLVAAWEEHKAKHHWVRRKISRLVDLPRYLRMRLFQWRTRKKF